MIMNEEDVMINEGVPVMIILIGSKTPKYGIYHIKEDRQTIILEDKFRNKLPISISVIGMIEPVQSIKYADGGSQWVILKKNIMMKHML